MKKSEVIKLLESYADDFDVCTNSGIGFAHKVTSVKVKPLKVVNPEWEKLTKSLYPFNQKISKGTLTELDKIEYDLLYALYEKTETYIFEYTIIIE